MDSILWTVDWNPDFAKDSKIKGEVMRALQEGSALRIVKGYAEQAEREGRESGLETEHIVWLAGNFKHSFFVRVWFEEGEGKLFIIIEENDLGDVGFVILNGMDCATYEESKILKVEYNEETSDGDNLGVTR